MQMSDLKKRFITGVAILVVSFALIFIGGWPFNIFVIALTALMSFEFDFMRKDGFKSFVLVAIPLLLAEKIEYALLATLIATAFPIAAKRWWLAASVVYLALPAISIMWLRNHDDTGISAIFWLVFVVVATDIGGYFAGKLFGKRKLAPAISPNKTWEGLAGGVALASLASFVVTFFSFSFMVLGAIFAVIEQVSDLMESAIKRRFGVKDSGSILPGHGGIMDRLDGLVLVAPIVAGLTYFGLMQW